MKKTSVIGLSMSLMSFLILPSYGDDGIAIVSSPVLRFSTIYEDSNPSSNALYVVRKDTLLSTGSADFLEYPIRGIMGAEDINSYVSTLTYLAPNFYASYTGTNSEFEAALAPSIQVLSPTVYSRQILANRYNLAGHNDLTGHSTLLSYNDLANINDLADRHKLLGTDNQQKALTFTHIFDAVDISGVTSADKHFHTPLTYFNLNESQFPSGALCYAQRVTKPSFSVFQIANSGKGLPSPTKNKPFTSLADWIQSKRQQSNNSANLAHSTFFQVGENNEYQAVFLNDGSAYDDNKGLPAAVEIEGYLYDADYIVNGYETNTDPNNDERVGCYSFNDIAADYLEAEIQKNDSPDIPDIASF